VLALGTFVVGAVSYYLPPETFRAYLGGDTPASCFLGAIVGGILYMPTLLEVPIVGTTFGYFSDILDLAPAASLANMIVLCRIFGVRSTAVYISLVVIFSTVVRFTFGRSF